MSFVAGANRRRAFVADAYWWNHAIISALFDCDAGPPVFCKSADSAIVQAKENHGCIVAWASRLEEASRQQIQKMELPLWQIEDGFVRSVGLGAGYAKSASLAVDGTGIYYDSTRPSDIETLLETIDLSADQCAEGRAIRDAIVDAKLSKYNLPGSHTTPEFPKDCFKILVPGQVADDASIRLSRYTKERVPISNINLCFLADVRKRNPNAYIIFKPHPDVQADLRTGAVSKFALEQYADVVVATADILSLIDACDAVETISSLTGFEALMRSKPVTCHGLPFYAGWGVTEDLSRTPRRSRHRTLEELCYIIFTIYTHHINPNTGRLCSIHELINSLSELKCNRLYYWRTSAMKKVAWAIEKMKI